MLSIFSRRVGILLILLSALGSCLLNDAEYSSNPLLIPKRWRLGNRELFARAPELCGVVIDEPDTPACRSLCSTTGACAAGPRPSTKRDVLLARTPNSSTDSLSGEGIKKLSKRVFGNILQTQLGTYLNDTFDGNDLTYGIPAPIIIANQVPQLNVVVQRTFSTARFSIGTQGLCGCTVVTVVSNGAVFMGHFFEVPTWTGVTEFRNSVLQFFSGTAPVGQGPQMNAALFPAQNTRVYIMSPRRTGSVNPNLTNYRGKVVDLKNRITAALGGGAVPIVLYNYIPRDCESDHLFADEGGNALFQYDPDSDGAGNPGWRLFYERHLFSSTDPAPGPAAAFGIPDV